MRNPYEDDIDVDSEYVHISEFQKYEDASEFIKVALHCIYEDGDMTRLEDVLAEICEIFGLRLPDNDPVLEKRSVRSRFGNEMFDLSKNLISLQGENQ